jgi:hypothetical protein
MQMENVSTVLRIRAALEKTDFTSSTAKNPEDIGLL